MKRFPSASSGLVILFLCLTFLVGVTRVVWADTVSASSSAETKPLSLGFFPLISTVALYKRFAPLREYLSDELHRPVELETAKDFPTFLQRTDQRQYDIVVTAPHFAVRATDSGKYRLVAALAGNVQQLLVVREDSPITSIEQLAGKQIATPPADALMTMVGIRNLRKAGLTGKRAPRYRAFTSHNAANEALLAKDVDAAIASSNVIKKALGKGAPFRILARSVKMPNMATMVAMDLDPKVGEQLVRILVDMQKTEKGRDVLKQIRFPGYREVKSAKEYEPMREYMEQALRELNLEKHETK